MPRSEWTWAFAFEPVLFARGSRTPVDNPPSVEAVVYRWRARTGWDRLTYRQKYWSSLVYRVKFSCRSFSCRSIITHEYVIAFVNEVLYPVSSSDLGPVRRLAPGLPARGSPGRPGDPGLQVVLGGRVGGLLWASSS